MSDKQPLMVPDIKNGFIINALENENRWQTFIESCLVKTENGQEQTAFFGTPCRAERVSPEGIFSYPYYAFAIAHTWKGSVVMRSGAAIHLMFRRKAAAATHYALVNLASEIRAPIVETRTYQVDDLIGSLNSDSQQRDNFIYMQVVWEIGDISYKLICPCRYINFSNDNKTDQRYVQPISGDVLVEHNDQFHLAYVSAHVTPDGTQKTELILKDKTSLFELKHYNLYRRKLIPSMAYWFLKVVTAPFSFFLTTDEYCRVIDIDAKCTFFTYSEN